MASIVLALPFLIIAVVAFSAGGWSTVALVALGWFLLAGVLVAVLRLAVRTAVPVGRLVVAAGRLADGDYTARVESTSSKTVQPVVSSFNRMAQQLEDANTNRRRLLADINHELRTPLTVLRGELEAIADGVREPTPDQIRVLLHDVAVIERLLGDLQTLSLTEDGRLALRLEPTDLAGLADDVVDRFRSEAQATGVSLSSFHRDRSEELVIDPIRVHEVISNLVVNALRAVSAGGEVIVETWIESGGNGLTGHLEVSDDGSGIAADELPHVFERFRKGADSSGSGLGLTISKRLVEAHGGTIDIHSNAGSGTAVRITLPDGDPDHLDGGVPNRPN